MNHCILMAEVVQPPQLRYTSDSQTPVADFTIKIPGTRPEDPPAQLKAVGWGNLAQEIQTAQYQAGDRILIEGRLTMRTVDRPEGFREKQAEVNAQRVYRLSDLQELPMAEAVVQAAAAPAATVSAAPPPSGPTSAPATAAEPDYDDIPF